MPRKRSRPEAKYFAGNIFLEIPMPTRDGDGNLTGYEWKKTDLIRLLKEIPDYDPFRDAKGFYFSSEEAEIICNFIVGECVYPEGKLTGKPFVPERWQWAIYLNLYCWFKGNPKKPRAPHLEDYRRYNEALVYVPRKNGKMLRTDTPIPTPSGWTTMGELKVNDVVFDKDGKQTRVVFKSEVDVPEQTYKITFASGQTVEACSEHQWFIHSRKQHPKYSNKSKSANRRAGERTVSNKIGKDLYEDVWTTQELFDTGVDCYAGKTFSVPMHSGIECSEKDLPIDPYILGYWLGDGTSSAPHITVGSEDIHNWSEYKKTKDRGCWRVSIPELSGTVLRDLGVKGNKHIPQEYLRASRDQRMSLLQGLMDSDGTISKRGTDISIVQKNERLANTVLDLLRGLGLKATLKEVKKTSQNGTEGAYYHIQFAAGSEEHQVFTLQRKLERMKPERKRSKSNHIVSIEPCESSEMQCIQVDAQSGTYLFGEQYLVTHNTTAFGAIPALISVFCDPEKRSQNFCCAADTEQANNTFRHASYMVEQNPRLVNLITQGRVRHSMRYFEHNNGRSFKVLSSIADTKHGLSPNLVIVDEVHAHPNSDLIDVMITGTGARENPLVIYTTTADYNRASPCNELHKRAKAVCNGTQKDPHFLPVVYEADVTDDWEDPKTWKKANPNYGISITDRYIKKEAVRCKNNPVLLGRMLRLHLNIKTSVETAWLPLHLWTRTYPKRQESLLLTVEQIRRRMEEFPAWFQVVTKDRWLASDIDILLGQHRQYYTWFFDKVDSLVLEDCYGAFDNAAVSDIASFVLFFPGTGDVLNLNWVPADSIERRSVEDHIPYDQWFASGLVNDTTGATIDEDKVADALVGEGGLCHHFESVQMICFDAWRSNYVANKIAEYGINCGTYSQGHAAMHPCCKKVEELLDHGAFFTGGNKVLEWMVQNTMVVKDSQERMRPSRKDSTDKIDGIVATLTAVGGWLSTEETIIKSL